MTEISIDLDRDRFTGRFQVSINAIDDKGFGEGYRLIGPKYIGQSQRVDRIVLNERDAKEIRSYLDRIASADEPEVQE